MEIKINIKKKHLYYLTGLICLLLIGLVMAVTPWGPGMAYHEPLYTDTITSKTAGNAVTVEDDLTVTGKLTAQTDVDLTGDIIIKDSEGNSLYLLKGEITERVNTGWADGNTKTEDLGTHKFCFLTYHGTDDVENAGNEYDYCVVDGSFNGKWTVKAYSEDGAGNNMKTKCGATCID